MNRSTEVNSRSGRKRRILFLCANNSCRSQMAEGLLRHFASDRFEVFSAGSHPTRVHPLSIKVMKEIGIDISGQRSKSVNEFLGKQFNPSTSLIIDSVVTLCDEARQTCPLFPGNHQTLHWNLQDPAQGRGKGEELLRFRKVRNQIKENILNFLNLPRDKANLRCPWCGYVQEVIIPQNSCLYSHQCQACHKTFTPTPGSCCVICAYSDKNCPGFIG